MNAIRLVVLMISMFAASPAVAQVLSPREALGETRPTPGNPAFYARPVAAAPHHGANCSPSRASTKFSSAISTGAARVWDVRFGTENYAVIWRRGQSGYRAVQLIESRSGKVAQKTVGKHVYKTKQEAADAIAAHCEQRLEVNRAPHFNSGADRAIAAPHNRHGGRTG